jgi:nucleotide-binding universal stress UspA family protein
MSENTSIGQYTEARMDFRRARFRAKLEQVVARWGGGSAECLEYETVRKKLGATGQGSRRLQDIPIDAIVGSVGRCADFTRTFWPRQDSDEERWAKVKLAMTDLAGLPPIEVYQLDQVYFVLDGNHRVSIARQLGAEYIQAYVTAVKTDVPLSSDVQPDDLILKAEYAEFLSDTRLPQLRPDADLSVSVPGQYQKLREHISVHRYFMGLDQRREIPYAEAVTHWYDTVYLPVAKVIREQGVLRDFPGRTEADLYLWVMDHRTELVEEIGVEVDLDSVVVDLAARFSPALDRTVGRVGRQILDAVTPDGVAPGPPPGQWRQARQREGASDGLFTDVLVAIDGQESGWRALEWSLQVARREQAWLYGLHVASLETEAGREATQAVQVEFERRCAEAGVSGKLTAEDGNVARLVCDRARWMDLAVLSLSHPYAPHPLARLESGLRTVLRRCPTPVVVVPNTAADLNRVLLAYDDSPKAREALFVATYLAGRWDVPLVVLTVTEDDRAARDASAHAKGYLEDHGVQATYIRERGPVATTILTVAEEQAADLIILGGYGLGPVAELAWGSTVEEILRSSAWPVLVCQ